LREIKVINLAIRGIILSIIIFLFLQKVTKDDFDLVVVLGVGSFGKVMKVKSKVDGKVRI
jgi:hypothetical protein